MKDMAAADAAKKAAELKKISNDWLIKINQVKKEYDAINADLSAKNAEFKKLPLPD